MTDSQLTLDPKTTALVLIDLQKGILGMRTAPHAAPAILQAGIALATRFQAAGAPVVLVNVGWEADFADAPKQPVDSPRPAGALPADFAELAPELVATGPHLVVTKRHWGAFYGTELDLKLRRRGITTLVLGGIATNFGVESTARSAWEYGYAVVFAEDAMTSLSEESHRFAVTTVFPRIGRVRQMADLGFGAG